MAVDDDADAGAAQPEVIQTSTGPVANVVEATTEPASGSPYGDEDHADQPEDAQGAGDAARLDALESSVSDLSVRFDDLAQRLSALTQESTSIEPPRPLASDAPDIAGLSSRVSILEDQVRKLRAGHG